MGVRVVTATTLDEKKFWRASYLGRSLALIPEALRPEISLCADNTGSRLRGLPEVYNAAIDAAADDDVLVLVHDDVYVHDWYLSHRALEACARWDVAGVAGAVDPDLSQPSWYWTFDADLRRGPRQDGTRSGAINHYDYVAHKVELFGPAPAACALLDGVRLMVHAGKVRAQKLRFDERFRFHLYDLDFCRAATAAGLRVGTWPVTLTHNSQGAWSAEMFQDAARLYLDKWRAAGPTRRRLLRR